MAARASGVGVGVGAAADVGLGVGLGLGVGVGMEREEEEKTGPEEEEEAVPVGEWRSREVRSEMRDGKSRSAWDWEWDRDRAMAGSARRGPELGCGGGMPSAGLLAARRGLDAVRMGGEGWTWERGLPDWLWLARDDDAGGRNGWRAEQPAPQLTWIGFSVGDFFFFQLGLGGWTAGACSLCQSLFGSLVKF